MPHAYGFDGPPLAGHPPVDDNIMQRKEKTGSAGPPVPPRQPQPGGSAAEARTHTQEAGEASRLRWRIHPRRRPRCLLPRDNANESTGSLQIASYPHHIHYNMRRCRLLARRRRPCHYPFGQAIRPSAGEQSLSPEAAVHVPLQNRTSCLTAGRIRDCAGFWFVGGQQGCHPIRRG